MRTYPWLFLIGRILFGGFFLLSGINHFTHLKQMAGYAAAKGVPAPELAVIVAGLLILFGGLFVLLGVFPRIGLLLIALFLIPVTFAMHDFWSASDAAMRASDQVNFMKNLALLGATAALSVVPEPWPYSLKAKAVARRRAPGERVPA